MNPFVSIVNRKRFRRPNQVRVGALIGTSLMLVFLFVAPVAAQSSGTAQGVSSAAIIGDITPSMILNALITVIGGGVLMAWVNGRIDGEKAERTQQLAETAKNAEAKRQQDQAATENLTKALELLTEVIQANADDRKEQSEQRAATTEHLAGAAESQAQTATTLKDVAGIVKEIRTRDEAAKQNDDLKTTITQYTATALDTAQKTILDKIESAKNEVLEASVVARQQAIADYDQPMQDSMDRIIELLTDLINKRKRETSEVKPVAADASKPITSPN